MEQQRVDRRDVGLAPQPAHDPEERVREGRVGREEGGQDLVEEGVVLVVVVVVSRRTVPP